MAKIQTDKTAGVKVWNKIVFKRMIDCTTRLNWNFTSYVYIEFCHPEYFNQLKVFNTRSLNMRKDGPILWLIFIRFILNIDTILSFPYFWKDNFKEMKLMVLLYWDCTVRNFNQCLTLRRRFKVSSIKKVGIEVTPPLPSFQWCEQIKCFTVPCFN